MGVAAAALFARAQRAQFYVELTAGALSLLAPGRGQTLLDAGCGPGLLARQAQALGYTTTGADRDPAMIAAARILTLGQPGPRYVSATAQQLADTGATFDVVAAASLLAVADDKLELLLALWTLTAPGGSLLVIEPTDAMTSTAAHALRSSRDLGPGAAMLSQWARARQGRTVDARLLDQLPFAARRDKPLVGGLVCATLLTRAPRSP